MRELTHVMNTLVRKLTVSNYFSIFGVYGSIFGLRKAIAKPQLQQMVLDTGSQLSWIQCYNKKAPQKKQPPTTSSSDPSLSSSFFVIHKKTRNNYIYMYNICQVLMHRR